MIKAKVDDQYQFLIEKYAIAITPGLELTDPKPISEETRKVIIFALTQSTQAFNNLINGLYMYLL